MQQERKHCEKKRFTKEGKELFVTQKYKKKDKIRNNYF
jgi:hypothetical protein